MFITYWPAWLSFSWISNLTLLCVRRAINFRNSHKQFPKKRRYQPIGLRTGSIQESVQRGPHLFANLLRAPLPQKRICFVNEQEQTETWNKTGISSHLIYIDCIWNCLNDFIWIFIYFSKLLLCICTNTNGWFMVDRWIFHGCLLWNDENNIISEKSSHGGISGCACDNWLSRQLKADNWPLPRAISPVEHLVHGWYPITAHRCNVTPSQDGIIQTRVKCQTLQIAKVLTAIIDTALKFHST